MLLTKNDYREIREMSLEKYDALKKKVLENISNSRDTILYLGYCFFVKLRKEQKKIPKLSDIDRMLTFVFSPGSETNG